MQFGLKKLANGSVWKHPQMSDYRIRVRFSLIPRRLRIPTGGSVWALWEQYGVLERLVTVIDWNGMDHKTWSHVDNVTLSNLVGMEMVA